LATKILVSIINAQVHDRQYTSPLHRDRLLGSLFGLARAALIVLALALLAGLTGLPGQPAWKSSASGAAMAAAALAIKPWLPETFASRLRYH